MSVNDRLFSMWRIAISEIEGKWKLNQNHSLHRRENLVKHLEESNDQQTRLIGEYIKKI